MRFRIPKTMEQKKQARKEALKLGLGFGGAVFGLPGLLFPPGAVILWLPMLLLAIVGYFADETEK